MRASLVLFFLGLWEVAGLLCDEVLDASLPPELRLTADFGRTSVCEPVICGNLYVFCNDKTRKLYRVRQKGDADEVASNSS